MNNIEQMIAAAQNNAAQAATAQQETQVTQPKNSSPVMSIIS